jgi:hypothetical protein
MSANSSDKRKSLKESGDKATRRSRILRSHWWLAVLIPGWVLIGFGLAREFLFAVIQTFAYLGVPFDAMNKTVLNFMLAACIYILSVVIVIGVPWWVKKYKTSREELGLTRLPSWMDILLAPAAGVFYIICSIALLAFVKAYVPEIDLDQVQETGFSNLNSQYELILAFITLIIIAPVFEEVLFRGYLYGKLRKAVPIWLAILIVSVVFAVVHGQWNVALDVFVLSIVLCILREMTGNIWAGILLHMCKNGLAFYFLFVNPVLLRTMGG